MTGKELRNWRQGFPRTPRAKGTRGPVPAGLTQAEAAILLGCSEKHYQRMETGIMKITARTATMARLLKVGNK